MIYYLLFVHREKIIMELVSIVVPIYGIEKFVADCIESIIHQTYSNLEIILVDDGGKGIDKCPEICDKYAALDSRIKVIHQENLGRHGSRNSGLRMASGEYIMFVDGDDMLKRTTVEECVNHINKDDVDAVAFYMEHVDEAATIELVLTEDTSNESKTTELEYCSGIDMLRRIWGNMRDKSVSDVCWNKLYRRNLIANLYFPANYYEDSCWLSDMYTKVDKWCILNKSLYFYRIRRNSGIRTLSLVRMTDSVDRYDHRRSVVKVLGDKDMTQKATREYLKGCITGRKEILKNFPSEKDTVCKLRTRFKQDYRRYLWDLKATDRLVFGVNYVCPWLFVRLLDVYNKHKF
jgi:glycosyltransferase involved in cell wall biosynthesis